MLEEINDSKMAMWRSAIALAYADNVLTPEEKTLLEEFFKDLPFTDAQKNQLSQDMEQGVVIDDVFPLVTEKRDRAHLINIARVLFNVDGEFSEEEKLVFEKLHTAHMESDEMKQAIKSANEEAKSFLEDVAEHDAKKNSSQGRLEKAFNYLSSMVRKD